MFQNCYFSYERDAAKLQIMKFILSGLAFENVGIYCKSCRLSLPNVKRLKLKHASQKQLRKVISLLFLITVVEEQATILVLIYSQPKLNEMKLTLSDRSGFSEEHVKSSLFSLS